MYKTLTYIFIAILPLLNTLAQEESDMFHSEPNSIFINNEKTRTYKVIQSSEFIDIPYEYATTIFSQDRELYFEINPSALRLLPVDFESKKFKWEFEPGKFQISNNKTSYSFSKPGSYIIKVSALEDKQWLDYTKVLINISSESIKPQSDIHIVETNKKNNIFENTFKTRLSLNAKNIKNITWDVNGKVIKDIDSIDLTLPNNSKTLNYAIVRVTDFDNYIYDDLLILKRPKLNSYELLFLNILNFLGKFNVSKNS